VGSENRRRAREIYKRRREKEGKRRRAKREDKGRQKAGDTDRCTTTLHDCQIMFFNMTTTIQ
jgi:hypothetical protein